MNPGTNVSGDDSRHESGIGETASGPFVGIAGTPGEGPYAKVCLWIEGGLIVEATSQTNGCATAVSSAATLCRLVKGRDALRAMTLESEDLIPFMGGIPEGKADVPARSVAAFKRALDQWQSIQ